MILFFSLFAEHGYGGSTTTNNGGLDCTIFKTTGWIHGGRTYGGRWHFYEERGEVSSD